MDAAPEIVDTRRRELILRLRRGIKLHTIFNQERENVNADLYTTDIEIALLYLKWNESMYTHLGALRSNYKVMEASIVLSGDNAIHFNGHLIDLALWKKCLAQDATLFERSPAGLDARFLTQEMLLQCLDVNGFLVEYVQNVDKAIAIIAVTADAEALECLDPNLYENDIDIAMAVIEHVYYGHMLELFTPALRSNFTVALAAVRSNGSSLEYLNPSFRRNKEICFEAVREDSTALPLCALDLPWGEALVCVVLGHCWRSSTPQKTRLTFEGISISEARVNAYVHDLMRSARAFDLITLDQKTDARAGLKRARRNVRLNDDSLAIIKSFLSPCRKMFQEAVRAQIVLQKLAEDEPRHRDELQQLAERNARKNPRMARQMA